MPLRLVPVDSAARWEDAVRIRTRVFIDEQACPPEEEWDAYDPWDVAPGTVHHVLLLDDAGTALGTARWRVADHDGHAVAKLERFAVLPEHRGKGAGRWLVGAVAEAARAAGHRHHLLHAQHHLEPFYASFGFRRCGATFWEAGILHVPMEKTDDE